MADEEPVDQKRYLEDRCKPKCVKQLFEYQVELQKVGISQGLSSASLEPGVSWATTSLSFETRACVKRIEGDETGHKHCTGQYFDLWSCIDKCVAEKLLEKLK